MTDAAVQQPQDPTLTMFVTMKFQVQEVNSLLTFLNSPEQAPTIFKANFINAIQQQVGPQIDALKANLAAPETAPAEASA
jgi:hypothetical protein